MYESDGSIDGFVKWSAARVEGLSMAGLPDLSLNVVPTNNTQAAFRIKQ
jgi:hypothetical protein